MEIVGDPEPVTEGGVKVAFAPAGKPAALSVTSPLKPLSALTVVLPLTLWPGITLSVGVADVSRKSAAVLSVTLSKVAWAILPKVSALAATPIKAVDIV